METFGFMLKSYGGDFDSAARLVTSFSAHNVELLPMDIVVPPEDVEKFSIFSSDQISVISEATIPTRFAINHVNGIRPGYINQEIVKLAFHRLKRFEAYLCLDSDAIFLRDFFLDDFISPDGLPYTVLVDDKELASNRVYREEHWVGRLEKLNDIKSHLGVPRETKLLTCHGFQIFRREVLQAMEKELLGAPHRDFLDLLTISAYEFSWYNFYLQSRGFPIHVTEPFFRSVHTGWQFATERLLGFRSEDFKFSYVGLVHNSNFQIVRLPAGYDAPSALVVGLYLDTPTILRLIGVSFVALFVRLLSRSAAFMMSFTRRR